MQLLVISGGRHPYAESTPILGDFLSAAGYDLSITEDASILANEAEMREYDALIFNTRRENLPDFGDLALSNAEQDGLKNYIRSGKGFVCLHIGTCVPDVWPEFHDITGGGWITGSSFHPPYGEFTVNISNPAHPGASGVSDFTINDELYMGLAFRDDNDVFLTADAGEGTHPWGPQGSLPTCQPARFRLAGRASTALATCLCCCSDTMRAAFKPLGFKSWC